MIVKIIAAVSLLVVLVVLFFAADKWSWTMSDNKRIGLHIAALIDVLIEEISSLKHDEDSSFDIADVYELRLMSNKYCQAENA